MMNRYPTFDNRLRGNARQWLICALFGLMFSVLLAGQSRAQLTLDGTNCVLFADMFDGELARCVTLRTDGSTLKISLIGSRPNTIRAIELSINGLAPFQMIKVNAHPTIDQQNIGLLITDMNFDQLPDFALMEMADAGPGTPYLYFLFDAETGKFKSSTALSDIAAPLFDARTRTITSDWRDGAARSGRDSYVWRKGKLTLVERIERIYGDDGCRVHKYAKRDGELKLLKSEKC